MIASGASLVVLVVRRAARREEHEGHVLFAVRIIVPLADGREFLVFRVVVVGVQVEEVGEGDQGRVGPGGPTVIAEQRLLLAAVRRLQAEGELVGQRVRVATLLAGELALEAGVLLLLAFVAVVTPTPTLALTQALTLALTLNPCP